METSAWHEPTARSQNLNYQLCRTSSNSFDKLTMAIPSPWPNYATPWTTIPPSGRTVGDLGLVAENSLVELISGGNQLVGESIRRKIDELKQDLHAGLSLSIRKAGSPKGRDLLARE